MHAREGDLSGRQPLPTPEIAAARPEQRPLVAGGTETARSSPEVSDARPVIVVNQGAGTVSRLEDVLDRIQHEVRILISDRPGTVPRLVREAVDAGCSRLIVAGGDGTLHEALNGLAPDFERVTLAVLPCGTGNDMAQALGLSTDAFEQALRLAINGTPRPADVVRATAVSDGEARHFINMCYGGFGGRIADHVAPEAKARWGLTPFWVEMARRVFDLPVHQLDIEADGSTFSVQAHGLVVANSLYLGGGLPVAPQARLHDGAFEVTLVPPQSALDAFLTTLDLLRGRLDESERVATFSARTLHVRGEPELTYTMDGESAPGGPLRFEILPAVLQLVAADGAPAFAPAE